MKLIRFCLLFFLSFSLFWAPPLGGGELTIAFIPKSLDNPIFLDAFEGAKKKALELGVKLEWVAPFTTDPLEQVKILESLVKKGAHGIMISCSDSEILKEAIDRSMASGVPVATFDSDAKESQRLFYIGTDNEEAGSLVGEALLRLITSTKERDTYKSIILSGNEGALNLDKRIYGFTKVLANEIPLQIVDVLYCMDNIQLAIKLVEDAIVQYPSLDLIFFVGGWPFYAPADAMPNFQRWAFDGGLAVGIDIFYSALLLQKEGLIDFLVGQDFFQMGALGLEYLVKYLQEGEVPPPIIYTGLTFSHGDNLEELLQIHQPWEVR